MKKYHRIKHFPSPPPPQDCKHNTAGSRCHLCAPGYYGDATLGRSDDCQPCACPLEEPSNKYGDYDLLKLLHYFPDLNKVHVHVHVLLFVILMMKNVFSFNTSYPYDYKSYTDSIKRKDVILK